MTNGDQPTTKKEIRKYIEYVELYNYDNSPIDVNGWFIGDKSQNDTLSDGLYDMNLSIPVNGYAIITDDATRVYDNFNVSKESIKLYVDDDSIGNGLGNTGDNLYLYNKSMDLIDSFSYSSTVQGQSCSLFNESIIWCNSIPTPGYFNNGSYVDYYFGPCDWYIDLILNETYFQEDEFEFRVNVRKNGGGKANVKLIREIKNVYGETVSGYNPLNKFLTYGSNFGGPWTPNYDPGMYFIKTCIETDCNEVRLDNNCDEKLFVIESEPLETNSSIKIDRIYDLGSDEKARFGQTIKVKLEVYKGETSKKSVIVHIEDEDGQRVSKDSKVNVEDKFNNYTLTIPVQLIPNCNEKFGDGNYNIVVNGLGDRDKEDLEIQGIDPFLCEVVKEIKEVYKENNESVLNDDYVTGSVIYEGESEKQGRYAIYGFCFSLVMLIVFLLWKNE